MRTSRILRSTNISYICTIIIIGLLTGAIIAFPSIALEYIKRGLIPENTFVPLMTCEVCCIVPSYAILFSLLLLIRNIRKEKVFTELNCKLLRIISWCCFAIAVIFVYLSFYFQIAIIVSAAAAFFGLILRVIKNVFERAIELKDENDFTI